MQINEFSAAQRKARMQQLDEIALCIVALVCVLLCAGVLVDAAIKSEARAAQRAEHARKVKSDARLARTGSRLCYDDGREVDPLHDTGRDEPLRVRMSTAACKD